MPALQFASPGCTEDAIAEHVGRLPPDVFAEACLQILTHLQGRGRAVDLAEMCDKCQNAGVHVEWKDLQDVVRWLSFHFRAATKHNFTADQLIAGLGESSAKWPRPVLEMLLQLWTERGTMIHTCQEILPAVRIGQLVDLRWKLAMAVSSDTCRSLNSPYVTLSLKVADSSGEVTHKSFEMTIPQFQNFFRQFKEMAAVLETV
ncbi:COMM domain-containing protein 6 [Denticeps clupeoides]|uniref:COMM domain-containing protein 6 n=1 Tax=Denticeps clupeoides TaxID=299321 RepID=UPI0010A55F8B|nr:COMM domain-containing protein 6 [Denticeps clupeoides]